MVQELNINKYDVYWHLTDMPFQNTPDPRFLYLSSQHEEALARMLYTVQGRKGAGLVTGVFGCGKTILVQELIDRLSQANYKTAVINSPQLEPVELLRAIVRNLKAIDLPQKKTELSADYLLEVLGKILQNNIHNGQETVVIIDEAHVIKDELVFEQLRLLLNFQLKDRFMITLLLIGQPELKQIIEDNKPFDQRIAFKYFLDALNLDDTKKYIQHRLDVAGQKKQLFTDEAIPLIYKHSGGIPRLINNLCDLCLLIGASKHVTAVDEEMVKQAITG
jgi:general secretion pathway protein A